MRRLRAWLGRRRIERALREAGWPLGSAIFTGNVLIDEVRYAEERSE